MKFVFVLIESSSKLDGVGIIDGHRLFCDAKNSFFSYIANCLNI